ncbi:MAG: sulfite exporter TauE/SafE family protein [Myxococcota bacterium]
MVLDASTVALVLFVLLAFTVEAALGFGATLVTVTLGSLVMPVDQVLPAFVPLNVLLSLRLVSANRGHVRLDLLLRRILPLMVVGLPIGIFAFAALDAHLLVRLFGVFVIALAALELWRAYRDHRARSGLGPERPTLAADRPFGAFEAVVLVLGGIVHGAFGTGGPMVVYVGGRLLPDKAEFRATLSALWLLLNVVLVTSHVVGHRFTSDTALLTLVLAPALVLGLIAGDFLHHRIPADRFKRVVFAMLAVAGLVLALR